MSIPQNQGRRPPHAPSSPPAGATPATSETTPSDETGEASAGRPGVLERLKAARPGATAPTDTGSRSPAGMADDAAGNVRDDAGHKMSVVTPAKEAISPTATSRAVAARAAAARAATAQAAATSRMLRTAGSTSRRLVRRGASATTTNVRSWNRDVFRSVVVTLAALACIFGSAAGVGAFGGPSISDAAGGVLAPDATLLAPAARAFAIWSAIYAGLILYTLYQWLPSQRTSKRQRRLGWVVASSMLLNLAWILSVQASMLPLSLGVILLLLGVLLYALRILNRTRPRSRWEGALVDVPLGLYLGWVIVAAAANIASVVTAARSDLFGWGALVWALVGLAAVALGTITVCMTDRGRLSVAFAACWGLVWIAIERFLGEPNAPLVAFAAIFAVFLVLVSAGSRRHSVDHNYRRWTRAQQDASREPLDLLATEDSDDADR
ncbi:hypothetical protein IWX75_002388 [Arthrobacter sp. CAN_A6]|uniref:tryptophan-rich sensory protein n=1 Tax=Arthrobacter sp. CAN_A6 TaxID=2787721 RepID=UPI0018CA87CF